MTKQNPTSAAILNFVIWGTGYIYTRRTAVGLGWLVAYALVHMPWFLLGLNFFRTSSGWLTLAGHIVISVLLAYDCISSKP